MQNIGTEYSYQTTRTYYVVVRTRALHTFRAPVSVALSATTGAGRRVARNMRRRRVSPGPRGGGRRAPGGRPLEDAPRAGAARAHKRQYMRGCMPETHT